jgi:ssDNA-binding Zn-finger/Zn-ribbon topoisomerase 1
MRSLFTHKHSNALSKYLYDTKAFVRKDERDHRDINVTVTDGGCLFVADAAYPEFLQLVAHETYRKHHNWFLSELIPKDASAGGNDNHFAFFLELDLWTAEDEADLQSVDGLRRVGLVAAIFEGMRNCFPADRCYRLHLFKGQVSFVTGKGYKAGWHVYVMWMPLARRSGWSRLVVSSYRAMIIRDSIIRCMMNRPVSSMVDVASAVDAAVYRPGAAGLRIMGCKKWVDCSNKECRKLTSRRIFNFNCPECRGQGGSVKRGRDGPNMYVPEATLTGGGPSEGISSHTSMVVAEPLGSLWELPRERMLEFSHHCLATDKHTRGFVVPHYCSSRSPEHYMAMRGQEAARRGGCAWDPNAGCGDKDMKVGSGHRRPQVVAKLTRYGVAPGVAEDIDALEALIRGPRFEDKFADVCVHHVTVCVHVPAKRKRDPTDLMELRADRRPGLDRYELWVGVSDQRTFCFNVNREHNQNRAWFKVVRGRMYQRCYSSKCVGKSWPAPESGPHVDRDLVQRLVDAATGRTVAVKALPVAMATMGTSSWDTLLGPAPKRGTQ